MKRLIFIFTVFLIVLIIGASFPLLAEKEIEEKVVTINHMYGWWRQPELDLIAELIAEFESQNPNIKIKNTQVPWSDYYREVITALAGGVMPDVLMMSMAFHVELMEIGALEPLNDYVTPKQREDIFQSSWDFWTVDGKIAAIPTHATPVGMVYRRDLFEKAGLDPDRPPKTWAELIEYAKKLKKITGNWAISTYATQPKLQYNWTPVMYTAGCPLLVRDNDKWKSVINTPEGLSGMHAFTDLITVHKVMPESAVGEGFAETLEGFKQGKYPIMGPLCLFMEAELTKWDPSGNKWNFMEPPVIKEKSTYASFCSYGMSSSCEHKKEAWKFLEYIMNAKNVIDINIASTDTPIRKSALNHPYYQQPKSAIRLLIAEYVKGCPKCLKYTEIQEKVYSPLVHEVMLGKLSVEEAAKIMDEEANKILE